MTNMNTTTPTYGINTDLGRAVPWSGRPIDGGRLRPAPLGMPLEQALSLGYDPGPPVPDQPPMYGGSTITRSGN
jgi:hypothetical protein